MADVNKAELNAVKTLAGEVLAELEGRIIPFWAKLRDNERGGFYGYMDFDLNLDKDAEKGCILNSRILWFFANAYKLLGNVQLKHCAEHAFEFLEQHFFDKDYGGVYWSVTADGSPLDTTKHTYNQAFAVYALASLHDATANPRALELAWLLFDTIEDKCTDEGGYLESFTRSFELGANDKLSENGVLAARTMNTLLHVCEAYTELYRVTKAARVRDRLLYILGQFANKVWDKAKLRQKVFFDDNMNSIIDLYSYGHDIETSWLIDRALDVLGDAPCEEELRAITGTIASQVYTEAYRNNSLNNECDRGVVNTTRVWWVQAESVVGFLNAWQKTGEARYLDASRAIWEYIKANVIDPRPSSEWFWEVDEQGVPNKQKPIVEPWKCPYHNGRMCFEVLTRAKQVAQEARV